MNKNRFKKAGRKTPNAQDIRYLLKLAVEEGRAVIVEGFDVQVETYSIMKLSRKNLFSDDFLSIISTFIDGDFFSLLSEPKIVEQRLGISRLPANHLAVWKKKRRYWQCMRDALFSEYTRGDIGKLPRCIDKNEFTARFSYIICLYNALEIYLKHHPIDELIIEIADIPYRFKSIEYLFLDMLRVQADIDFAAGFQQGSGKELSPSTKKRYLLDIINKMRSETAIYKNTPEGRKYLTTVGDSLITKSVYSMMYRFCSGWWLKERLSAIPGETAKNTLKELKTAEYYWRKRQIEKLHN
jgi:hypothetical protein